MAKLPEKKLRWDRLMPLVALLVAAAAAGYYFLVYKK
jgi:hypothetical protein